jgi:hypothetical protein
MPVGILSVRRGSGMPVGDHYTLELICRDLLLHPNKARATHVSIYGRHFTYHTYHLRRSYRHL